MIEQKYITRGIVIMSEQTKVEPSKGAKIIAAVIVVLLVLWIASAFAGGSDANSTEQVSRTSKENKTVLADVETALNGFDKEMQATMASTSIDGFQGEIVGVEADGNDGVKVKVSTNYTESGDEENGGQNIARKIFSNICLDVPELDTLYVTSTSSGLDSRSVYRSDIAGCKL